MPIPCCQPASNTPPSPSPPSSRPLPDQGAFPGDPAQRIAAHYSPTSAIPDTSTGESNYQITGEVPPSTLNEPTTPPPYDNVDPFSSPPGGGRYSTRLLSLS